MGREYVVMNVAFGIPLVIGREATSVGTGMGEPSLVVLSVTAYVPLVIWGFIIAGTLGWIGAGILGNHTDDPKKERFNRNYRTYSMGVFFCSLVVGLVLELVLCSGIVSSECVEIIPYI